MRELILGGARSGKSRLAQQRAGRVGRSVVFVATAWAGDAEMAERIARHRAERPDDWTLVEEPFALADALARHAAPARCLLVDCLTLWLSNLLHGDPRRFEAERTALLETVRGLTHPLILVSNEVGLGLVPADPLSRQFRDEAGRLHQDLAALCQRVVFVTAGLPLFLKGEPW